MRFCMITTFYPPYNFGGDGIFTYRLSNELARRGHEVHVIHCRDAYYSLHPGEPDSNYPNHQDITVHSLKSRAGVLSPLLTQQLGIPGLKGKSIHRILKEGNFDVIHYHNISLVGGPGVLKYGKGIKLYTMHEYWLICPTHVLFKFNEKACDKPECLRCEFRYRRPPQLWRYSRLMQKSVAQVDAFIAPSKFAAQIHRQRGLDIPIVQIPMFIPEPQAKSDPAKPLPAPNSGKPYFLFVGRLEKLKGVQDVIPLFRKFAEADFIVVGKGDYQSELRRLAEGNPRVKFTGSMPYEELLAYYRNALAVLVPSLCYETFGQIIMEAFAMRAPVIARNIGALKELVTESGGGLLFETIPQLREAMRKLAMEPLRRKELGENGFALYQKQGKAEHFLEKYFALIEQLRAEKKVAARPGARPAPLESASE